MLTHIRGGTVSNAEIEVSLAADRLPEHPEPFHFGENEFVLNFDADGLGMRYLGDLPAAREMSGRFRLKDRHLEIAIARGEFRLPSGKVLKASAGSFVIADTADKPLMASLDLSASGDASGAAEYVGFKPIDAMAKLPFAASDLKGAVSGTVSAVFGLNAEHDPPKPAWKAELALKGVTLAKPVEGRKFENIDGTLKVDNKLASLDGKAKIDGMGFDVKLSQPITGDMSARRWEANGRISEAEMLKFVPALEPYVKGGVELTVAGTKEGQRATVSLRDAVLSIPFVNCP